MLLGNYIIRLEDVTCQVVVNLRACMMYQYITIEPRVKCSLNKDINGQLLYN